MTAPIASPNKRVKIVSEKKRRNPTVVDGVTDVVGIIYLEEGCTKVVACGNIVGGDGEAGG